MIRTLKALSALLTYPSAELQSDAVVIAPALREEGLLPPARIEELETLLTEMTLRDLFDLQERFVFLFDLAAIAAFVWALVVTYQIWRGRRG